VVESGFAIQFARSENSSLGVGKVGTVGSERRATKARWLYGTGHQYGGKSFHLRETWSVQDEGQANDLEATERRRCVWTASTASDIDLFAMLP